jgi:putative SOS response-associated peptidase YedK
MCNLYSQTTNLEAIRRLFKVSSVASNAANLPAQSAIFPAYDAPVIRQVDGERELSMMHWGFILPQQGRAPKVVNNTRDDKARASRFWSSSFEERRCLIPATSFAEYHPKNRDENGHKTVVWFAMKGDEPRPPFALAGIWRSWKGNYKNELREMNVYSMLTTAPNEVVKPIHPSRMPVILDPAKYETWLTGSLDEAAQLLRPFPANRLHVAIEGGKEDVGISSQHI